MKYAKPEWRNGQPYNADFDDIYFSIAGGTEETEYVFIRHNQLIERFQQVAEDKPFVIAETGFGSGLNFLVSAKHWLELTTPQQCLYFYSVESLPFTPEDLAKAHAVWPEFQSITEVLQQQYQVASAGFHYFELFDGRIKLVLMIGDVTTMLPQMQAPVDAWFLDGFAPGRNPTMWSDPVFAEIRRLSHNTTTFSTYTSAGIVKRGLSNAGFKVRKVDGHGSKRDMLCGELVSDGESNSLTASVNFGSVKSDLAQPWYVKPATAFSGVKSVCIIGAGITGLCSAWSLVRRGYQVELIEAADVAGAQASGNPRATIMPRLSLQDSADAEFYLSAYFYALRCLQQLDPQQQIWSQSGGIQLASTPRFKKQIAGLAQDKALVEVLDAAAASQLAGLDVSDQVQYYPQAASLYPLKILQCLIDVMGKSLSIRYNSSVKSIVRDQQQWQLRDQANQLITTTDKLIVAGAWQSRLFSQFAHLPVQPVRGQLSFLRSTAQSQQLRLPLSGDGYLLPAEDDRHVLGASFILDDTDTAIRDSEHRSNIDDLNHWYGKMFSEADICGGRVSVRAVTPDRVPMVGPAPDVEFYQQHYADLTRGKPASQYPVASYLPSLYVNTGHGARGFSSAFLSAELLAAYICDEPLPVSNRVRYALHPARFLIRSLKKNKSNKRA